ncbi:hypothetical protein ACET3Z_022990 [Daucus carota]
MEVIKCRSLRSRSIHFGPRNSYEFEPLANSLVESPEDGGRSMHSLPKWKIIWRKLKREKKKILETTTSILSQSRSSHYPNAYDEYNYSQNFDQGASSFWDDEPDILPRSFSVRFSDSSSVFRRFE